MMMEHPWNIRGVCVVCDATTTSASQASMLLPHTPHLQLLKLHISDTAGVIAIKACDKDRWAFLLTDDAAFVIEYKSKAYNAFAARFLVTTRPKGSERQISSTHCAEIFHRNPPLSTLGYAPPYWQLYCLKTTMMRLPYSWFKLQKTRKIGWSTMQYIAGQYSRTGHNIPHIHNCSHIQYRGAKQWLINCPPTSQTHRRAMLVTHFASPCASCRRANSLHIRAQKQQRLPTKPRAASAAAGGCCVDCKDQPLV